MKPNAYKASDGAFFSLEEECIFYEEFLVFKKWYDDNRLSCCYEGRNKTMNTVDAFEVFKWLKKNNLTIADLVK